MAGEKLFGVICPRINVRNLGLGTSMLKTIIMLNHSLKWLKSITITTY